MPKPMDEAPLCSRCHTRHWNYLSCTRAAEQRNQGRIQPIYRHNLDRAPPVGIDVRPASFADMKITQDWRPGR